MVASSVRMPVSRRAAGGLHMHSDPSSDNLHRPNLTHRLDNIEQRSREWISPAVSIRG